MNHKTMNQSMLSETSAKALPPRRALATQIISEPAPVRWGLIAMALIFLGLS